MQSPSNGGVWGILGGAFNPVHRGHLALALDMCTAKRSDGVLLVPSYIPPRKVVADMASWDDRLEMLNRAISSEPRLVISTIESESDTPGYTLLTVRALKKRYPAARFYFIIGADLLAEFETWFEAHEILQELPIAVGARPGSRLHIPAALPHDKFETFETTLLDISSRNIRAAVREGIERFELAELVPEPVADYIFDRGLYR